MSVVFLLILLSLILAIVFLSAFIWSVRDGQYEDEFTPSVRILFDDDKPLKDNPQTDSSLKIKKENQSTPTI